MAFNAGSIEATLTLSRAQFIAGLQKARQDAEKFAREKFEITITPKLDKPALQKVKADIEKTAGTINVKPKLDRTALATVKSQIEKVTSRIDVKPRLDRSALATVKSQIEKTAGRINVKVFLDRDSLAKVKAQIERSVARINVRLSLDKTSLAEIRARIERMSPVINVRANVDRSGFTGLNTALRDTEKAAKSAGDSLSKAGEDGSRSFEHMDRTARLVLMTLPLLLPVAGTAITGLIGGIGGVISILGTAGAGMLAFGGVAVSIWGDIVDGAALSRAEIAKLPPGISQAAGALKTLKETWDALVVRTRAGVGEAIAAGMNAATAAVKTLDSVINAMSKILVSIGKDIQWYFGTAHWANFVGFISANVGPTFMKLWEIVKFLTHGVMDLVVAFNPLAQWMLDRIVEGVKAFSDWASKLAGDPAFAQWLELVKQSLSSVFKFLGVVIEFLFKLSTALAPFGKVILDVLTMIFEGLNKLPPEWLAGIAMGFAGLFAALALGATGPVGLVVGLLFGIAAALTYVVQSMGGFQGNIDQLNAALGGQLIPTLDQVKSNIETKIKPAWDAATAAIRDNFMPVIDKLWGLIQTNVLPVLSSVADTLTGKFIPAFLDFVTNVAPLLSVVFEGLGQVIVGAFTFIGNQLNSFLTLASGVFELLSGILTGDWSKMWQGIKDILSGFIGGILAFFGISLDDFWATMSSWGTNISNWWNGLWSGISNFFTTVWDGIVNFFTTTIPQAWDSLTTGAGDAVTTVLDFFRNLPSNIAYALGFLVGTAIKWGIEFAAAIGRGIDAVINWFETLPERIKGLLADAGHWLATTGLDILIGLKDGIVNGAIAVEDFFRTLPDKIKNFLQGAGAWLLVQGLNILLGLQSGISSGWDAVTTWFSNLPNTIAGLVVGSAIWLWSTGLDIINGLWEGIKSAWNGFTAWIGGLITEFIAGVMAGLGIASPSTIFADMGMNIIMGLINGVSAMWQAIIDFFSNLWNTLISTAAAIWQGIVAAVSGAVDAVLAYVIAFGAYMMAQWSAFWTGIWNFVVFIWQGIVAEWNLFWAVIGAAWNAFVSWLGAAWSGFWQGIWNFVVSVWNGIVAEWNLFWAVVGAAWNAFVAFLSGAWSAFWQGIWNFVKSVWAGIVAEWNLFWATVSAAWNAFVAFLGAAWNGFWNGIWNFVKSVWAGIVAEWNLFWSTVRAAWDGFVAFLGRAWAGFWDGLKATAKSIWDGIVAVIKGAVNGVIDAANWMVDQVNKVLGFLHIPLVPKIARLEMGGILAMENGGMLPPLTQPVQMLAAGGNIRSGFATKSPVAIVGEGKTSSPEYVIPTQQKYRSNAKKLFFSLGEKLGITDANPRNAATGLNPQRGRKPYPNTRMMEGGGILGWLGDAGSWVWHGVTSAAGAVAGAIGDLAKWLDGGIMGMKPAIKDAMASMIPQGIMNRVGDPVIDWSFDAIKKLIDEAMAASGNMGGVAVPPGPILAILAATASQFGWGPGSPNWNPLLQLVQHESGFNPNAQNPTSTAYGLFQFLNGTWAGTGIAKTSNPSLQALAGMRYIANRYVNPIGAWNFWQGHHSYDAGGWLMPGPNIADNQTGKPEAVLNQQQWNDVSTAATNAPTDPTVSNEVVIAGIDALGGVMGEIKELLERRGAGASITVEDRSGNPVATARAARLALRLS